MIWISAIEHVNQFETETNLFLNAKMHHASYCNVLLPGPPAPPPPKQYMHSVMSMNSAATTATTMKTMRAAWPSLERMDGHSIAEVV